MSEAERQTHDEIEAELRHAVQDELERDAHTAGREAHDREAVVELRDVVREFPGNLVLDHVSFRLFRGETLAVLGGSGTGKSTILRLIMRLDLPNSGDVHVMGCDITRCSADDMLAIRRQMGMVFQGAALFDSLSVFDNVAFPLYELTDLPEHEIASQVRRSLSFVDLDPDRVGDLLPAELSGGMKKRVGVARALIHKPRLLLFDEPTSGLDPITTTTINQLIRKMQRELTVSTIVVTHDIRSAFRVAGRVALLAEGHIIFIGSPEEMMASDNEYVKEFLS
jgi:phospholipid/cholesterol/gamma-HCH transport system ATP-binding protein